MLYMWYVVHVQDYPTLQPNRNWKLYTIGSNDFSMKHLAPRRRRGSTSEENKEVPWQHSISNPLGSSIYPT